MTDTDTPTAVDRIVEDAHASFDLGEFLRGRSHRTRSIRLFTDEKTAEKRGGVEPTTRRLSNGLEIPDIRSWGKVGDLAEAQTAYENLKTKNGTEGKALKAKIAEITDDIRDLTEKLLATALDVELRSVPPVVVKDARRAAKKHLGINTKGFDFDDDDQHNEYTAQLLSNVVVSITKHGTTQSLNPSVDDVRLLADQLPASEWGKLISQLNELVFEKTIADAAVEDSDFSHGI